MLLGNWKNIDELEEALNLHELRLILTAAREKELRTNKFMAALKGIDLDKANVEDAEARFKKVQDRVQARLNGQDENTYHMDEMGLEFEVEE